MENKGQGALEYLLLIGGAVLIAVIVIALVTGVAGNTEAKQVAYCASLLTCTTCNAQSATPNFCHAYQASGTVMTVGCATAGQTFGVCKYTGA